jgi:hypothetical protein
VALDSCFRGIDSRDHRAPRLRGEGQDEGQHQRLQWCRPSSLTAYTGGERSSRGIPQGMYPSDLFGNFYLAPIDRFLDEYGVPSARYVDDIYIFLKNVDSSDHLLRELIPALRSYDLVINEAKASVMPKAALVTEEPDLETLFAAAIAEIASQIEHDEFDVDYGFQSDWEENETSDTEADDDLELKATTVLFDSIEEYPGQEESIERFCLPLFAKADSDYAIDHVLMPSLNGLQCQRYMRLISQNSFK